MAEIVEQEVQLNEADIKAISEAVAVVNKDLDVDALNDAVVKALGDELDKREAAAEEVSKKAIADKEAAIDAADPVAKGIRDGIFADIAKESKEMRLFKAARALAAGDQIELKRYNQYAMASRTKAGYANETTAADGAVLVPDPEFDTQIYDNLASYGVAFRDADVRTTDRTSVYALSLDQGLTFFSTAEAGAKTGAQLQFSRKLTALQKYAVIVPSTDELTDDAAIDFWALVTKELTRAYAKVADDITFIDPVTGITNTSGIITQPVTGAGTTIKWADLLTAEGKTEDGLDTSGYKWYMRRETWFRLVAQRADAVTANDAAGMFLFAPNPNQPVTPWGTPVVYTRSLLSSREVGSNDGFAVYGDLQNYKLYTRRGMDLKILTEATIKDANAVDFNLATQDGTAMRAVVRILGILPKGNASKFVVVGTGAVS